MSSMAGGGRRPGKPPRARNRSATVVSAWILGGLGALTGVIVALINVLGGPATVNVNIGDTHSSSPTASAAPAAPSPAPAAPSTSVSASPPNGTLAIVFRDDFCTKAGGWTTGAGLTGGHYGRCALDIYANPNDVEASEPAKAGTLPPDLTIEVTARRIIGSAAGDEFGIACRAGNEGYTFIVQADSVAIYRYSNTTGIIGRQPLTKVAAGIDMNASNRLQATCSTVSGGSAVDLTLEVNGKKLAEATDTGNPLTSGTVGLFAATTQGTSTPTEDEFTNFVVTRM